MHEPEFNPNDIAAVHIDDLDPVVVVRIAGEIDMATSATVGDPLFSCLDETPRAVVVDLTRVQFIGSTGLNLLVQAYRRALRDAIALRIVADTRAVLRPLEISGLYGYLPISHSMPEAFSSIDMTRKADTGQ